MNRILAILTVAAISVAIPCSAAPGVGDKLSISVTNKYGDVFSNLTVVQIVADGIVLEHKSGQMKVKYENLPQSVREKYQPLVPVIAEKELEHAAAGAAYEAKQKQLQADATKAREQKEQRLANLPVDKNIDVPDQGWKIVVLDVGFVETGRTVSDEQFIYQAAGKDGFNLTIFVEKPSSDGDENEDVFKFYWPKTAQNPLIDPKSVKAERWPNFIRVTYIAAGIPNANYYFTFRGKWADVHISKSPYSEADSKLIDEFQAHLAYY